MFILGCDEKSLPSDQTSEHWSWLRMFQHCPHKFTAFTVNFEHKIFKAVSPQKLHEIYSNVEIGFLFVKNMINLSGVLGDDIFSLTIFARLISSSFMLPAIKTSDRLTDSSDFLNGAIQAKSSSLF